MNELQGQLIDCIRKEGPISLASFMQICSFDLQGYYRQQLPIGPAADFITAPEISQIFNEMIAFWLIDSWQQMGEPFICCLLELGAGRGTLLQDIWRVAKLRPSFQQALRIHIVETNHSLRNIQQQCLQGLPVTWHTHLPDLPGNPILVVANEFFDVFPIHQFKKMSEGWLERMVSLNDQGELSWQFRQSEKSRMLIADPYPPGTVWEYSTAATSYMKVLAQLVCRNTGVILVIDYGRNGSVGESFQAVKRHQAVDPLQLVGECDVTAWVDFSALAQAAIQQGMSVWGPLKQAVWLERMGFKLRMVNLLKKAAPLQAETLKATADRLLSADQMGDAFKVAAFSNLAHFDPAGFIKEEKNVDPK